jgi:sugar phosphate isomerase/epimerase
MSKRFLYSVFTKPWKLAVSDLADYVKRLGFNGIELPVRKGYQVEPAFVAKGLPNAARVLADSGLKIFSVAGPTDEATIAACAESEVPLIRICVGIEGNRYLAEESRRRKEFDKLIPLLEKYGVKVGIQNHCGKSVANAMQLRSLLHKYDPKHIGVVWDPAHNALNGEEPEHAIDIVLPHLCMVNLKNAFWKLRTGPEAPYAQWQEYWTMGRYGLASWPRVAAELKRRNWSGVLCLSAEYSDQGAVDRLVPEDLSFARYLFDSA